MAEAPAPKGRIIIDAHDDGSITVTRVGLSPLEASGVILSAWRREVTMSDLSWHRAILRAEALDLASRDETAAGPPVEKP